jgi:pyruvate,water dikinase
MKLIAWFDELPEENIGLVAGGKGASLCRLYQNGFPVTKGFIVCAGAFERFMKENGLLDRVYAKLDAIDWDDDDSLSETGEVIRGWITGTPVPDDITRLLVDNYRKFGNKAPVAVRSSGTAEDLDDASFAGQQETFLYVVGEEDLVRYVNECWASLYNDRAIFYRHQKKFDERGISIAVVVMRMVNSDKAGVLFSANPINQDRNTVMIEGAWGLGEGVVQGIVNPDNYLIKKGTYETETEYVAEKEIMVVRRDEKGSVHEVDVPEHLRNAPVLTEDERKKLVDLAVKAEDFYGKPPDLEWAVEDGKIYLLQSRPITTLE